MQWSDIFASDRDHVVGDGLADVLVSHQQSLREAAGHQESKHQLSAFPVNGGRWLFQDEKRRRRQEGACQGHANGKAEDVQR